LRITGGYRRGIGTEVIAIILVLIIVVGIAGYFLFLSQPGGEKAKLQGYIKVGFTVPLTGNYSEIGSEFLEGVKVWGEWANQTGIKINGQTYGVKIVYYDDKGDPQQVTTLYEKLITSDKVDFLITPPVDPLARAAIQVAEQYGKIIIVTTPEESLFRHALKYSYQIVTPGSKFFTQVLDISKSLDPNSTKIAIIFIDTPATRVMASGVKLWATQNGYQIVFEYYYKPGQTKFDSIAIAVAQKSPDIIVGGGGIQETMALVKALYDKGVRPKVLALLDAPLRDQFTELGNIAIGVMGVSEWEVYATYSPFGAQQLNLTWYGPSLTEFVVMYNNKYKEAPTSVTAIGFASGLVIQYGVENASSTNTEKVMQALDNANLLTLFGVIKFDSTPELHGLQIGHQPLVIQWVERGGQPVKVVIAPQEFATAQPLYPLPWG